MGWVALFHLPYTLHWTPRIVLETLRLGSLRFALHRKTEHRCSVLPVGFLPGLARLVDVLSSHVFPGLATVTVLGWRLVHQTHGRGELGD
ncbi:hypothetical protein LY78DRAFT_332267 [Colletotrichum sublineola]|nr:hypothetical protein LY78DRAFT_332267 [Colletotrichum sublineola]